MHFHRFSHSCAQREDAYGSGERHRRFGLFGGRRRMFDQGDVRLVILKLISEKPSHGYEIIKAIEDRLGGAYAPSPGVVYPALTLLEEQGMIRVEFDRWAAQALCNHAGRRNLAGTQSRPGRRDLRAHRGNQCPPRRRPGTANPAGDGKSETRLAPAPLTGPAQRRTGHEDLRYSRRRR